MRITRNICMRNCYDTCSMLSTAENGRLKKVAGDPEQTFTAGTLCSKGYSYLQYVYNPDRILHPLRQTHRGAGNWERITWEEALEEITDRILKIYRESGSFLPLAFHSGTGNKGVLARAMYYMLSSLGPITQFRNLGAGAVSADAQILDFGRTLPLDPEEMSAADLIVLWGVNPAATSIHQMRLLQKVRQEGGEVILIDVYPSLTARRVDDYVLVKPGGDGALALAILRELIFKNSLDYAFLQERSEGWEDFRDWLLEADPAELERVSGVKRARISYLADKIRSATAPVFWLGKGLQHYSNSGQNIRAIHALAVSGGLGCSIYESYDTERLFRGMWGFPGEQHNRHLGFSSLTSTFQGLDPAIRMLWITQSNPLMQGTALANFRKTLETIELIVTTEHFLTETARYSDIILPSATLFETEDVVAGGWNKWIGLNEQTIAPLGEVKSELEIAQALTRKLNQREEGICPFPAERTPKEWLNLAVNPQLCDRLGISSYEQLREGPKKLSLFGMEGLLKSAPKYRFVVTEANEQGVPEIPMLLGPITAAGGYPYRLISIHQAVRFNSQLSNLSWLAEGVGPPEILIGQKIALAKGIGTGNPVMLYNQAGEVILKAKVCDSVPDDILICSSREDMHGKSINTLVSTHETDLGRITKNNSDLAHHETFVNLNRW